jgi:hypothetical protein
MKKALLLFLFCLGIFFNSFSQEETVIQRYESGFLYTIKLSGVDNFLRAKEIAFTLQEKFIFFPHFNDVTDCFEFYSNVTVLETDFRKELTNRGYSVELFVMKTCAPCEIKEQEQ